LGGEFLMADIRTLKLALLADTKNFIDGLDKADKETKTFSNKLDNALQKGAAAFLAVGAAAGAMAIKIGIDAVKAAIEDEKAQASLAQTLRNTTQATEAQIAATEDFIDKTARATGVADDQLRPSLQRLLVSTKDLTQAQKLQALALDISAGTGKDLLSVSDALAKASDGNFKALKNLGVELKTSETITKKVKVSQTDLKEAQLKNEDASLRLASAQERLNKALTKNGADSIEAQKAQNAVERAQISLDKASGKYSDTVDKQGKTIKVTKEQTISFDEAVKQLTENFAGQADIAANTFAGRMARIKVALDEAKEELGKGLLPLLEIFAKFATEKLAPALQGLVDGLTAKGKQGLTRAFYDAGTGAVTFGYDMDNVQGQAYLLGEQLRRTTQLLVDMLDKVTGAAEGEGFKKLLTVITSVISGLERAISLYNSLPDFGKLLINPLGQLAPLAGAAGQIPSVIKGQGTTVNNYNIKGAIDPQATARTITKVQNTANKTTGIKPFNFGFR
jgi:hypothetical protein